MGANDGGVKRGDREDTGDLQARPSSPIEPPRPIGKKLDQNAGEEANATAPDEDAVDPAAINEQ